LNLKLSEIEQLRGENARLAKLNARDDALNALIKQHCFPAESNSTPIPPIKPDSSSS
jgi:uncharacterized protein YdcH (DUF465 family)